MKHPRKRSGLRAHIDPTGKILRLTADVEDLLCQDGEGYAALERLSVGSIRITPIRAPAQALGVFRLRYQGRQMCMSGIAQLAFPPGTQFSCRWDGSSEAIIAEVRR